MPVFVSDSGLSAKDFLKEFGEKFQTEVHFETREILAYRDTFDEKLLRAGLTLATSTSGRNTRIVVFDGAGGVMEAVGARIPLFATDLPPGPIRDTLQPLVRHRRLLPKAGAEWNNTRVSVLNTDEKTVVRLLFREGHALLPNGRIPHPVHPRVTLFPLKGYRAEKRQVLTFARKRFKLRPENRTELSLVYDAVGLEPSHYTSSFRLTLDPKMTGMDAFRVIGLHLLNTMLANREGVTRDWDIEFLHDFRVAVRRTRSALGQLKSLLPEEVEGHFSEEFQWLGSRTGPTRDIDVYLLKIPDYRTALPPDAGRDLEPLVRLLREKKRLEHRRLRACFQSERFRLLMSDWQRFLEEEAPGQATARARRPVGEIASHRIWKAFGRVLKKGAKIGPQSPATALHRLRIECKKLRYLITFFRSLYPASQLALPIRELKVLQDHLGDFNDLQMQQEALHTYAGELMASDLGPPATLLAMGQLMGKLEGAQAREREAFHQYFNRFSRPKNQRRFRKLFAETDKVEKGPPKEGKES